MPQDRNINADGTAKLGQVMYFYIYTQIYVKNTVLTQMTSKVGSGLFPLTLLHNMNIQQPLLHATFKSVFFQLFFQEVQGTCRI